MRKLRYGMVGGGQNAFIGEVHRKSINLDSKAELVAGCFSRDFENTLETGRQLNISRQRLYESFEKMAAGEAKRDDGIDFVVVVTPNNTHFAVCKAFLDAGIHVVCDKPLVHEVWQAEELIKTAKEKNLLFAVTYTYGGNVTVKHAREIIASGEIGEIRMVMGEYVQGWLREGDGGKQGLWRMDSEQSGASNALGDIGTHVENTVAQITGLKIKRVLAKMDKIAPGRKLDDNSVVLVEYNNGASGTYWVTQIAAGGDNELRIRIYGSKGTIEWDLNYPDDITVIGEDGVRKLIRRGYSSIAPAAAKYVRLPAAHNEGYFESMANIYSNFCDCLNKLNEGTLKAGDIDFQGLEEGLCGVKFVQKCVESNAKGNIWVDF